MTPRPAAKKTEPEGLATEPAASTAAPSGSTQRPETNDPRADEMANEGPAKDPVSEPAPEAPLQPSPEPPQHCPVCGLEMVVESGYWVCSDQKCGTRLPHEFHPSEELVDQA